MKNLIVRLSNSKDYTNTFDLEFDLVSSDFLPKWIDRFLEAQQRQDTISEPWALYNCGNWSDQRTVDNLNNHIDICNSIHPGMFTQKLSSISDQDTLNYIHSVFELHHGKLGEQTTNPLFLGEQGQALLESLSQINQGVHRCESQGSPPRIRVVYFDLPKTKRFDDNDYKLFTNQIEFGGVYTLYADVGKNLESLAQDDDDHHHDFVPNLHYSVDFQIRFQDRSAEEKETIYKKFQQDNLEYFQQLGYSANDTRLTTGSIKIAQLKYTDKKLVLDQLQKYDNIQSVFLF